MDPDYKPPSKRKQKLLSLEMFRGEHQCLPVSNEKEPTVDFPDMKFGSSTMTREQLKCLLRDHLYLQTLEGKNTLGVGCIQNLTANQLHSYETYRLATVAWLVSVLPCDMMIKQARICTLIPAVNLMDRYIMTLVSSGKDLVEVLGNIEVIRAACLSLSVKMHSVLRGFTSRDIASMNTWAPRASVLWGLSRDIDKTMNPKKKSCLPDHTIANTAHRNGKVINGAIKDILTTLKGGTFPCNAENTISVICNYLVLDYFAHVPESVIKPHVAVERVDTKAFELFTRTALNVQCLTFPRWKCMAVCSLLAMRHVCVTTEDEELILKQIFVDIFQKLHPEELSEWDISNLTLLLTADCVVCANTFTIEYMQQPLLDLSAVSCVCCREEFDKK